MPDQILHHTWSLRTISPFAIPLFSPPSCSSLSVVEEQLTICARRFVEQHNLVEQNQEESSETIQRSSCDGTYVTLTWIRLNSEKIDESITGGGASQPKEAQSINRKRPRSHSHDACNEEFFERNRQQDDQLHLFIEIRVADDPSAQIVLCFAKQESGKTKDQINDCKGIVKHNYGSSSGDTVILEQSIQSFSFLLIRGSISIWGGTVLPWFESTCGCTIGTKPFCPTPQDVASTLAHWTTMPNFSIETEAKPLEITFSVPISLESSGLQKMSFTIPPNALRSLFKDIEEYRPPSVADKKRSKKVSLQNEDLDSEVTAQTLSGENTKATNTKSTDNTSTAVASSDPTAKEYNSRTTRIKYLPILSALQRYVLETFHLDIKSFPMIRASSSLAVIGCDGRCKPLDPSHLPCFLCAIETMVNDRIHLNQNYLCDIDDESTEEPRL